MDMMNIRDYSTVLNSIDSGVTVYYSKDSSDFEVLNWDEAVPADFIEVPYKEYLNAESMRSFWKSLGMNELYFPGERKFHSFIRCNGLTEAYYEYARVHALRIVLAWAKHHDIVINWDNFIMV